MLFLYLNDVCEIKKSDIRYLIYEYPYDNSRVFIVPILTDIYVDKKPNICEKVIHINICNK